MARVAAFQVDPAPVTVAALELPAEAAIREGDVLRVPPSDTSNAPGPLLPTLKVPVLVSFDPESTIVSDPEPEDASPMLTAAPLAVAPSDTVIAPTPLEPRKMPPTPVVSDESNPSTSTVPFEPARLPTIRFAVPV